MGPLAITLAALLGATATEDVQKGRQVGDHLFLTPQVIDNPYVESHIAFAQSGLYVNFANFDPGPGKPFNLELAGVRDGMNLEVRVLRPLSVFGRLDLDAVTGINGKTALFRGVAFQGAWRGGLGFEVLRSESTVLGLRGAIAGSFGQQIEPSNLARALIDRPVASFAELLRNDLGNLVRVRRTSLDGLVSLTLAQRLSSLFGLQAGLDVAFRSFSLREDTLDGEQKSATHRTDVGLGAAFDVSPHGPIAFIAEIGHRRTASGDPAGTGDRVFSTADVGFVHRDGRALELGLYLGGSIGAGSEDQNLAFGQLAIRYFY
jgi:hypothetical protein